MTPQEYVDFNDCKPLTKKELSRGKEKIKIYNTDEPMPWTEVYTYIAAGISMNDISKKYGHGRKIALWAIHDNQHYLPKIGDIVNSEIENRKKFDAIERVNPVVAKTLLEITNEYAPDFAKNIVLLHNAMVDRAKKIVASDYCTSSDLLNCANATQKMTDTQGITERFSSAVNISNNINVPTGFRFEIDIPPESDYEEGVLSDN